MNPSALTTPMMAPPASGIIVLASIVRMAPAANAWAHGREQSASTQRPDLLCLPRAALSGDTFLSRFGALHEERPIGLTARELIQDDHRRCRVERGVCLPS